MILQKSFLDYVIQAGILGQPFFWMWLYRTELIQEAGVLTTPGIGLGEQGRNYIRFSLTSSVEKIKEALGRIKKVRF